MEHKRFDVINHYLVEIPYNDRLFAWDIFFAINGEEYRGKAIATSKNLHIDWTLLNEHNYYDELIKKIEDLMILMKEK